MIVFMIGKFVFILVLSIFLSLPSSAYADGEDQYFGADATAYQAWYNTQGITYSNSAFLPTALDPSIGIAVFWNIDDDDESIQFGVAVQTTGWAAFGISSTGAMFGTDFVFFLASQPETVLDMHIGSSRDRLMDDCQSWELVSTDGVSPVIDGGFLIFEVKRPWDTQDDQDIVITNDANAATVEEYTKLIGSWGTSDQPEYHGSNRVRNLIRLFDTTGGNAELVTQSFQSLTEVDSQFGSPPTDGVCPTIIDTQDTAMDPPATDSFSTASPTVDAPAEEAPPMDDPRTFFGSDSETYQEWFDSLGILYTNHILLPQESDASIPGVAVFWNIDGDYIQFGVATKATGWVAFGTTSTGSMLGSDVFLFLGSDTSKVSDLFIKQNRFPSNDDCEHWELVQTTGVSPVVDGGFLIVEARRLLNTNDPQDLPFADDSMASSVEEYSKVLAAWGDTSEISYHGVKRSRNAIRFFDASENDELLQISVPKNENVDANFGSTPSNEICTVEGKPDDNMSTSTASGSRCSVMRMLFFVASVACATMLWY